MPRVFVFSSHGSMPMIEDESFAMPELPESSKKTASKKLASKNLRLIRCLHFLLLFLVFQWAHSKSRIRSNHRLTRSRLPSVGILSVPI